MAQITVTDLVQFVKNHRSEDFRKHISTFLTEENVLDLVSNLSDYELKFAIEWSRKENIFLVHRIFEVIEDVKSLAFLRYLPNIDKKDNESRTWLHIAVIHDRDIQILDHLINSKGIRIDSKDDYGYTPLHYYCQKEQYDLKVLHLLVADPCDLTEKSKDDLTPLEFACSNTEKFNVLRQIPKFDIKKILRKIDNISSGVMEVEQYSLTKSFAVDRIWLNLLQKNDKYMLLAYIKNDEKFLDKYFLTREDIISIIKKCPENGQGILTYIRKVYFNDTHENSLENAFYGLTSIKLKVVKKRAFFKSALFLCLITGRFELISPLLRCCQFEIIPYGLYICLICKHLAMKKIFPDQVIKDIINLKDFCEEYCAAVLNSAYNKDLSHEKTVIGTFLTRKTDRLQTKSVLEVAYHASCIKFLCLPCCQESLTRIWRKQGQKCPQLTFWLHSVAHVLFLAVFSLVVVNHLFSRISPLEVICYAYGLGYFVEELRQIFLIIKSHSLWPYLTDAANIIDLLAWLSMLIGLILRLTLTVQKSNVAGDVGLFIESKDRYLFIQRVILCLSLITFYMRLLYFASINRTLGPKMKMIRIMILKDLAPLLFIFIVFLISFGVTFQSLLFPNSFYMKINSPIVNGSFIRKDFISVFGDIFRRATFTVFDFQYTLNDIENNPNNFSSDTHGQYAVYILLVTFMVVVNVMLMNLLIALFSNTVTTIILESKQWWKSNRYGFIQEYSNRTIVPPPFNIIVIPFEILTHLVRRSRQRLEILRKRKRESDNTAMRLMSQENEIPDETSISYYIYQAFAMNGQRYKLLEDVKDLEYGKEIHFRNIESKLKSMESKLIINESKMRALEERIKSDKNEIKELIIERFAVLEKIVVPVSRKT